MVGQMRRLVATAVFGAACAFAGGYIGFQVNRIDWWRVKACERGGELCVEIAGTITEEDCRAMMTELDRPASAVRQRFPRSEFRCGRL